MRLCNPPSQFHSAQLALERRRCYRHRRPDCEFPPPPHHPFPLKTACLPFPFFFSQEKNPDKDEKIVSFSIFLMEKKEELIVSPFFISKIYLYVWVYVYNVSDFLLALCQINKDKRLSYFSFFFLSLSSFSRELLKTISRYLRPFFSLLEKKYDVLHIRSSLTPVTLRKKITEC